MSFCVGGLFCVDNLVVFLFPFLSIIRVKIIFEILKRIKFFANIHHSSHITILISQHYSLSREEFSSNYNHCIVHIDTSSEDCHFQTSIMLSQLPEDCVVKLISYLPLHSALQYASTSRTSMTYCLADLKKRQRKISQIITCEDHSSEIVNGSHGNSCTMPSALERLKCLRQSLHLDHTLRDSVHELIVEIESQTPTRSNLVAAVVTMHDVRRNDSKIGSDFQSIWDAHKKLMKGHKLHGALLRRVLDNESMMEKNSHHGKVPLHQYIGDLLIVYFCMGHSSSSVIEGISETEWVDGLLEKIDNFEDDQGKNCSISTNDWYQFFLCVHSTLLRTFPMTGFQMIQTGIATEAMVKTMNGGKDDDSVPLTQPIQFRGVLKLHLMIKISCIENCDLTSTIYEFGPLGPAFRGRDDVNIVSHSPVAPAVEAICVYWKVRHIDYDDSAFDPIIYGKEINHLIRAFRESKKNHPMNVKPPFMKFELMNIY